LAHILQFFSSIAISFPLILISATGTVTELLGQMSEDKKDKMDKLIFHINNQYLPFLPFLSSFQIA
jgi:hypothetical protein